MISEEINIGGKTVEFKSDTYLKPNQVNLKEAIIIVISEQKRYQKQSL